MNLVSRRHVLKTSGTALAVGLAGCGGGGNGGGNGSPSVDMTNSLTFDPKTITVSVGDTITWENTGSVGHTVTAYGDKIPDGATYFASGGYSSEKAARSAFKENQGGVIGAEGTYKHTFETTGTYKYFCIPHERSGMKGTVKVE